MNEGRGIFKQPFLTNADFYDCDLAAIKPSSKPVKFHQGPSYLKDRSQSLSLNSRDFGAVIQSRPSAGCMSVMSKQIGRKMDLVHRRSVLEQRN